MSTPRGLKIWTASAYGRLSGRLPTKIAGQVATVFALVDEIIALDTAAAEKVVCGFWNGTTA